MIRHRERSSWLPLFVYLSDNAEPIMAAASYVGGANLAKHARSVIDEVRCTQQPSRRLFGAIEKLFRELERQTQRAGIVDGKLVEADVENDFVVRAQISAMVDELSYHLIALQAADRVAASTNERGAA